MMNVSGARYARVIEGGRSRKVQPGAGVPVRPIFGGNWKMYGAKGTVGIPESLELARSVNKAVRGALKHTDVFIAPPIAYLALHAEQVARAEMCSTLPRAIDPIEVSLAAQDPFLGVSIEGLVSPYGAATGKTSIGMIAEIAKHTGTPIPYLIVGHSEPRSSHGLAESRARLMQMRLEKKFNKRAWAATSLASLRREMGQPDEVINAIVKQGLAQGFKVVLCVGETLLEREIGKTNRVVLGQIDEDLKGVSAKDAEGITIAYEPVWAIGTGKTATPEQAQAVHHVIRYDGLANLWDVDVAAGIRIQYGGSMKPKNVDKLMAQPDIDGGLVGGASLEAESFGRIVNYQI